MGRPRSSVDSTRAIISLWRLCGGDGRSEISVETLKAVLQDQMTAGPLAASGEDVVLRHFLQAAGGPVSFLGFWRGMEEILRIYGAYRIEHNTAQASALAGLRYLRESMLQLDLRGAVEPSPMEQDFDDFCDMEGPSELSRSSTSLIGGTHEHNFSGEDPGLDTLPSCGGPGNVDPYVLRRLFEGARDVSGPAGSKYWQAKMHQLPRVEVTREELTLAVHHWLEDLLVSEAAPSSC